MGEPEADDLLQAVDLIVAAHEIDQNIRAKCRRIGLSVGIVDSADWQKVGRPDPAMLAKLEFECLLQRVAIDIIGRRKYHRAPNFSISTSAIAFASIVVDLHTRKTFQLHWLPVISSVCPPVTICSLRFSAVTRVIASATAELTLPVMKST